MDFEQALKALRHLQSGESDALPLKELITLIQSHLNTGEQTTETLSTLTTERDTARTELTQITTERDTLQTQVNTFRESSVNQIIGLFELSGKDEDFIAAFRTRAESLSGSELDAEITIARDTAKEAMTQVTDADPAPSDSPSAQINWGGIDI